MSHSSDDTITITVADDLDQNLTISDVLQDGSYFAYDSIVTVPPILSWENDIELNPTITIGTSTLTESKLKKLSALLDIIEDDPEWAERLQTQLAFNKLRNTE